MPVQLSLSSATPSQAQIIQQLVCACLSRNMSFAEAVVSPKLNPLTQDNPFDTR
jgi:hypothetical protein